MTTTNARIELREYDGEAERLVSFLTSQPWPFHGTPSLTEESVRDSLAKGRYAGEETKTFWIQADGTDVGLLRLFDLGDLTPMFDIRIDRNARGQGIGTAALRQAVKYLFTAYPDKIRMEGHTRADNYAMRKTFVKAGFVKEGYHRKSWPTEGVYYDSVGYSILRDDWTSGRTTPVDWNDVPF